MSAFYLAVVTPGKQWFEGPFDTAEEALNAGDRWKKADANIAVISVKNRSGSSTTTWRPRVRA